jgi:hypothetical protein
MIQRLLLWASTICTAIVVLSFAMFALEQANAGSTEQQNKIENVNQPSPTPNTERARELKHTGAREAIDDADDVLVRPFAGVTSSSGDIWAQRGVPALLAFLVYFVVLRIFANYAVRLRLSPSG